MTKLIYTVYKITNLINKKIYIGVHKTTNPNDSYFGSGLHIKRVIQKHGKENFTKSILFEYNNSEDAYLKESQIVNQSFVKSKNTYNIAIGGKGSQSGELNPMFGKTQSIESNKLRSIKCKLNKHTNYTKEHLSSIRIGKLNPKFKGYYITPWGKFESSRLATNSTFNSHTKIQRWCKNPNKIITQINITKSIYLQSLKQNPIGKSFKELGFNHHPFHHTFS